MQALTVIYFLVVMSGLGGYFLSEKKFFERFVMSLGLGIAVFAVLSALFTVLHIPLLWWIFLMLALPSFFITWKNRKKLSFNVSWQQGAVALVFALTLFMYLSGTFSYALYEDGDPWKHAGIAKFIADEKSALEPIQNEDVLQYVDSYPPAYATMMAMLYQVSGDIIWTVKFFNALIISLATLFVFFFINKVFKNETAALFATTLLACMPAFLSHFIWAHALIGALLPVLFYFVAASSVYGGGLAYAGILVTQPTQALKISILLAIVIVVFSIHEKRLHFKSLLTALFGGFLGLLVWWIPMFIRYGGIRPALSAGGTSLGGSAFKIVGSADRVYSLKDFFIASSQNMINNPVGIGLVIMVFASIVLLGSLWWWKKSLSQPWAIIAIAWLIFTFLGLQGAALPIQLFAFRFWMLFAFSLALFLAWGAVLLLEQNKIPRSVIFMIFVLIILGAWFTSGQQKWDINSGSWEHTAGEYAMYGNLDSWKFVESLPKDTKVFYPCRADVSKEISLLGIDKQACIGCSEDLAFKRGFTNHTGEELQSFATNKGYEYLFIDGICLDDFRKAGFDGDQSAEKLNAVLSNITLPLVHRSDGGFVWVI